MNVKESINAFFNRNRKLSSGFVSSFIHHIAFLDSVTDHLPKFKLKLLWYFMKFYMYFGGKRAIVHFLVKFLIIFFIKI